MNTTKSNTLQLELLDPGLLPELQGWKEKQKQVVKDNPFITIEDHKSYELAKKSRTTLVTARTTIQNQDKLIASKLKDFRNKVSDSSKELIAITLPHEEKQQQEVKRYEAIKEAEKAEKKRLEEERIQSIKELIQKFFNFWKEQISSMTYELIDDVTINFQKASDDSNNDQYEEFELDFIEKVNILKDQLQDRSEYLINQENQRKEKARLAKERAKLEADKAEQQKIIKAQQEKAQKEADKIRKEQEAKEAELKKQQEKIEAEKAEIARKKEEEKQKEEAILKSKKEEEDRAAAAKEAQRLEDESRKRAEELQPDREKLMRFINSLEFSMKLPELIDKGAKEFLDNIIEETKHWRESTLEQLSNLK